jgi:hypothetical protein
MGPGLSIVDTIIYGTAVIFALVAFIAWITTAVYLSKGYRRTRNKGFRWLLLALIVWPIAQYGLAMGFNLFLMTEAIGFGSDYETLILLSMAVQWGSIIIGYGLVTYAVFVLCRAVSRAPGSPLFYDPGAHAEGEKAIS